MTYTLPELVEKLEKKSEIELNLFFMELFRTPKRYGVEYLGAHQCQRTIGQQIIPAEGNVFNYASNASWRNASEEFKQKYPQLSARGPRGLVDVVREVQLCEGAKTSDNKNIVELTIERYLIKPKTRQSSSPPKSRYSQRPQRFSSKRP